MTKIKTLVQEKKGEVREKKWKEIKGEGKKGKGALRTIP